MKVIGIYKITCLSTGKFYIGSSKNVKKRVNRHKDNLRRKTHPNRYLQSAWIKYGEVNFIFEVIQETDVESLLALEQRWLDQTKCYDRPIGFNLSRKAESSEGVKLPIRVRNKKAKKWKIISPDGKIFKVINLTNFCYKHGLVLSLMVAVGKSKRKHHKGWICYHANISHREWLNKFTNKPNGNNKSWLVISPSGGIINIKNLTEFCKANNLNRFYMYKVASGLQSNHKGWKIMPSYKLN